jgi:hypothetical protein
MLISEIHYIYKIAVDKVDTLSTPNLLPEEIDVILNESQAKYIQQRANGTNIKRESLEETQKRLDDLKDITEDFSATTFITNSKNKPNGKFVELPANYLRAMEEDAEIQIIDCHGNSVITRVPVKPVTHDRYNRVIRDPFNKPFEGEVSRLGFGKSPTGTRGFFELITGENCILNTYYLRYLRKPVQMRYGTAYQTPTTDIQCEFDDQQQREIIALAVKDTLEKIESQRFSTNQQTLIDIE